VENRGPVRDKTHANIVLGPRLESFHVNLHICGPSPKGDLSMSHSFATMGAAIGYRSKDRERGPCRNQFGG